ncbi:MAG: hypothetical protein P8J50_09575 [Acidimicrobiales bacterium]|nr:hypothetical protein [Acidimicrobiales bacterium]
MPETPTRRTALKVGGGGALALVLGVGAGWVDRRGRPEAAPPDAPAPTTTSTAPPQVIPGFGEVSGGILALGDRVIATQGWDDLDALISALPDPSGDPFAQAQDVTRAEFRAGDTITVDGWVLARSEAQATAIVSLICAGDTGC